MSVADTQSAMFDWQGGKQRLDSADANVQRVCFHIITQVHRELARRLGPSFSVADLADEYRKDTSWFIPLATRIAPPKYSDALDPALTLDAAFALYMRHATDASLW